MLSPGVSGSTFYFSCHGEANTDKTLELVAERARSLGIRRIVVASETGLSGLRALQVFKDRELIVVSSAAGTLVEGSVIGDLRIGIPDDGIYSELVSRGAKVIRGTDPFWNITAHTSTSDAGRLGMMFLKTICDGLHVCTSCILEATDAGYVKEGEEVAAVAGSFVGLDTAIVATAANSVNFFKAFQVNEIICKPRNPRYSWPINQVDWRGDLEQYRRFTK